MALVAHDATPFEDNRPESGTADLNGEVRFASHSLLRFLCFPRPHAGATISTAGLTNQFYGGFTWTFDNGRRLFLDIDLGFAAHDGRIRDATGERLPLGSRLLFRAAAEPGFRFGSLLEYSLTGFWDHVSNASILGHPNRGLDTLGARFGYWFH